jgi:hypothetical protein
MKQKNLLAVCPMPRDYRELLVDRITSRYNIRFHNFEERAQKRMYCRGLWLSNFFDQEQEISFLLKLCKTWNIDGLIHSQDYPGSVLSAIAAERSGYRTPSARATLLCQNKYLCRMQQAKSVPEATPDFFLSKVAKAHLHRKKLPLFVKPIKANFSAFARLATSELELQEAIEAACATKEFAQQFNWFLYQHDLPPIDGNHALVEQALDGLQYTLEGLVFNNRFQFFGVTDSYMFENTISFSRFEFPTKLPKPIVSRMQKISKKFLRHIGFDNGIFNIEFFYEDQKDKLTIIEVNPRMASQFADIYEKVDGTNSYDSLLSIALNQEPVLIKNGGKHQIAASFVLRRRKDAMVKNAPTSQDFENFFKEFPDGRVEVFGAIGSCLSWGHQDGITFRYGLIHLGARDRQELFEKYDLAKRLLPFTFESR